jgi:hypothetical protein
MTDETEDLRTVLARTRAAYANLLAAARAALSAEDEGESDPLYYLRDELDPWGQR